MAGEIFASALLQVVFEKLASGIIKEFGLLWGVKGDLDRLESTVGAIKDVLQDAESRLIKKEDPPLYNWLLRLKDAAYDAVDLFDEFQMEADRRKQLELRDHRMIRKVTSFFSRSNPILFRFKMSHRIKEMRERLDAISEDKTKFHLEKRDAHGDSWKKIMDDRETASPLDKESPVCGREGDVERIMSRLLKTNDDEDDVSIIPIVGMGGLGKTTLAQLVYNDKGAGEQHFNVRSWVYVSADFEPMRIAKKAIESVTKTSCNLDSWETVGNDLKERLRGKKFLLVLDDVWNEDADKWEKLKPMLNVGSRGSKIIVTTRTDKVASVMGATNSYRLEGLSDDDCWKLFKQRAFGRESAEAMYPQLVAIGKEIVNKCGGVPLAAKALGSIMQFKKEEVEWLAVRDNEMWKLTDEGDKVLASLRLSYTHLPSPAKQCFAYCSLFPKGDELCKDYLISQWIAQGFIPSLDGSLPMENIANEYFNNLLWMSFLQDLQVNEWTNELPDGTVTCKMHDLVHDLARSIAGVEVLATDAKKAETGLAKGCRYAALIDYSPSTKVPANINLKKVRALHTYSSKSNSNAEEFPGSILSKMRCLRTLHLSNEGIVSLSKLRNLRYLHASILDTQTILPESICGLLNLQTLYLTNCSSLETLPESIGDLHNLQNLTLIRCSKLQPFPDSFGNLQHLQTLNLSRANFKFLPIKSFDRLRDNLQSINLSGCRSLKELPDSIGNLQNLRNLNIAKCSDLEALPESVSRLTRLESLNLEGCGNLKELPNGLGNMWNLKHLKTTYCYSLCGMPLGLGKLKNLRTLPLFVVGKGSERGIKYCSIGELEHLNHIEGELEIKNLERVMNPTDAKKANLKEKRNLHSLVLKWEELGTEEEDEGGEEAVLESLLPPPCIEELRIQGYSGTKYPSWMVEMGSHSFPNLYSIQLFNLRRCDRIPPLGQLPSLRKLEINKMPRMRYMGEEEVYGGGDASFQSLESLYLMDMPNLEEWATTTTKAEAAAIADSGRGSGGATLFPRLSFLWIIKCPKLKIQPCLPASIEQLDINDNSTEELLSAKSLRAHPSSRVRELRISNCGASSGWEGLPHLTALENLEIFKCDELRCLPESMRHLSSLRTLDLSFCDNLLEIPEWVGDLGSLQSLYIGYCPNLTYLPQGLRRLDHLHKLNVRDCPNLVKRCEREKGEDWDNIKHIPKIRLDYVDV